MGYELLEWDTGFFGFRVGRVTDAAGRSLAAAVAEADADGVSCLYLLCPSENVRQFHAALALKFRPYDIRVELSCAPLTSRSLPEGVREARKSDETVLQDLAREQMRSTRFWMDEHFPRDRVRALYVEWLRRGMSSGTLCRTFAADGGEGFVTCQFDPGRATGRIELIAVTPSRRGTGLGDALVEGAAAAFAEAGLERAEVVTQARNVAAQRLYQRHGYRTSTVSVWLHRWA